MQSLDKNNYRLEDQTSRMSDRAPKVSFVIPAHNEEIHLGQCLEAIKKEVSRRNLSVEIIVVNNCSTDSTKEVALSFSGVTVIDELRKGLTYARQAGLTAATGDLIAQIDADCLIPSGWMDTVLHEFIKRPDLVALSGPVIYYDLSLFYNLLTRAFYWLSFAVYFINRVVFGVNSMIQGGNCVIRKSALRTIGGYNTEFAFYGEDAELARRLNKIGAVIFTFKSFSYSSGRRLKAEGIIKTGFKYLINYVSTTFFGRPFHKDYIDVRIWEAENNQIKTSVDRLNRALAFAGVILMIACFGSIIFFTHFYKDFIAVVQAKEGTEIIRLVMNRTETRFYEMRESIRSETNRFINE